MDVTWEDAYAIGDPVIDSQHKKLFALINNLDTSFDTHTVKRTIMSLYTYCREHFRDEESLMREHSYPDYRAHKEVHEALITRLNTFVAMPLDSLSTLTQIQEFLHEWLCSHILIEDMKFSSYIHKEG